MTGKRRGDISIGDRFDKLVVLEFERRGTGSIAVCLCDCGAKATPTTTELRKNKFHSCASCARRAAWQARRLAPGEAEMRLSLRQYRRSAKKRNLLWRLKDWTFRRLYFGFCFYCDRMPAGGVDRRDNSVGYQPDNCVSCCPHCNYAKRDNSETEFLLWLHDIATKQGYSK